MLKKKKKNFYLPLPKIMLSQIELNHFFNSQPGARDDLSLRSWQRSEF